MRFALFVAAVALLGCRNKSKLDADRGSDADALWDLAPEGTEMAIVATPRAIGLGFRAVDAIREVSSHPDLEPAKPQLDALLSGLFGSPTGTPADSGFATDRAFAMFATGDGVIGVMPVGDRDKFMAAKKGTRGSAEDTLDGNTCRMLGRHYVCATKLEMFDRIGKGKLRGKGQVAGARGDVELFVANVALLGEAKGDLVAVAQLEPGQLSVHGRWTGSPDGVLKKLAGTAAPKPPTDGASGFVAINVAPLVAGLPPLPIAGGVTFEQLGKSLAGPITAMIPAGTVDIQLFAPLADPKPAQTVIDNCKDVGALFALADQQQPGACRIKLQGTTALELDIWIEDNTLRLGAKKGAAPAGKPGGMTPLGRELAGGSWTAAVWGRGTMLNPTGVAPAKEEVPVEVALGIHAIAVVNELGGGARVDHDGLRFRLFVRTAWANPPALAGKLVAFSGNDIVTGEATEPARALAAAHANTPFAADHAAGQGGLMIPAATIGLVSAVVMPIIMRMVAGEDAEPPPGTDEPMNQADLMQLLMRAYADEAYPKWQAENPTKKCPASLDEVAKQFGDNPGLPVTTDAWGHPLVMKCDDSGFSVFSVGPDGKAGTDDDVH